MVGDVEPNEEAKFRCLIAGFEYRLAPNPQPTKADSALASELTVISIIVELWPIPWSNAGSVLFFDRPLAGLSTREPHASTWLLAGLVRARVRLS